jgi:hypothetical protein
MLPKCCCMRLLYVAGSEVKTNWENDPSNDELRFHYACALSRSAGVRAEDDKRAAVGHFAHLIQNGVHVRDSLYNLALTEYCLADYEFARVHCEDLYRQDPDNKQVRCRLCSVHKPCYGLHMTPCLTGEATTRSDNFQAQTHARANQAGP